MHGRGHRVGLLVGAMLAASAIAAPAQAAATTRWVDGDGHAGAAGCGASKTAFKTIQAAIDGSGVGDVVAVCPGVYRHDLVISGAAKKFLTVRGVTPGSVKIRPSKDTGTTPVLTIVATEGIKLSKLVFQAPTTKPCRRVAVMVDITVAGASLSRIAVQPSGANTVGPCGFETGVHIADGASVGLDRVTVRDFQLTGVLAQGNQTEAIVEDSHIRFFHAKEGKRALQDTGTVGLYGRDQAGVFFRRNTIESLDTGGKSTPLLETGIKVYNEMSDPVVTGNRVRTVSFGLAITTDGGTIRDNTFRVGRKLLDFPSVGISISGGRLLQVARNLVRAFHVGIDVDGGATDHQIHDNDFRHNRTIDCRDQTNGGGGTSGTSDFWADDLGLTDSPNGLCSPS